MDHIKDNVYLCTGERDIKDWSTLFCILYAKAAQDKTCPKYVNVDDDKTKLVPC